MIRFNTICPLHTTGAFVDQVSAVAPRGQGNLIVTGLR